MRGLAGLALALLLAPPPRSADARILNVKASSVGPALRQSVPPRHSAPAVAAAAQPPHLPGYELAAPDTTHGFGEDSIQRPPIHKAGGVGFQDTDPKKGELYGVIWVWRAANETDITHYDIHWARNGTAGALIASLPKGRAALRAKLCNPFHPGKGVKIPANMDHLMVLTGNQKGVMKDGRSVFIWDYVEPPVHKIFKGFLRGGL